MIEDPFEIVAELSRRQKPVPESWTPYVRLAKRVGYRLVPVSSVDGIALSGSPGDVWAFQGTSYMSLAGSPAGLGLHEICHFLVAPSDLRDDVNFGGGAGWDSIDSEIEACNAQIAYLLVRVGIPEAVDVAELLNYRDGSNPLREDILQGLQVWGRVGVKLRLSEKRLQAFAAAWKVPSPDSRWDWFSKEEAGT